MSLAYCSVGWKHELSLKQCARELRLSKYGLTDECWGYRGWTGWRMK